jgi:hypothetical protein
MIFLASIRPQKSMPEGKDFDAFLIPADIVLPIDGDLFSTSTTSRFAFF